MEASSPHLGDSLQDEPELVVSSLDKDVAAYAASPHTFHSSFIQDLDAPSQIAKVTDALEPLQRENRSEGPIANTDHA